MWDQSELRWGEATQFELSMGRSGVDTVGIQGGLEVTQLRSEWSGAYIGIQGGMELSRLSSVRDEVDKVRTYGGIELTRANTVRARSGAELTQLNSGWDGSVSVGALGGVGLTQLELVERKSGNDRSTERSGVDRVHSEFDRPGATGAQVKWS